MMNKPKLLLALLALALLLAACAGAGSSEGADESPQPQATRPTTAEPTADQADATQIPATGIEESGPAVYASQVLAFQVIGREGQPLGTVDSLLVDSLSGQVRYVVVNGSLAPPDQPAGLYPLPWQALQMAPLPENEQVPAFLLDQSPADLAGAPALEVDFLTGQIGADDFDAAHWDDEIFNYWSELVELPERAEQPGLLLRLVGDLNYPLQSDQERLAGVKDFVVSAAGRIRYAMAETETALGIGIRQYLLPWLMITWDPPQNQFVLNASREYLLSAPSAEGIANLPDVSQAGWDADLVAYWQGVEQAEPSTGATPLPQTIVTRASQALGNTVQMPEGEVLGQVADLLLAPDGSAHYFMVIRGDRFLPLPRQAVEYNPQTGSLIYSADPGLLGGAPAYEALEALPASSAPGWDNFLRVHWSAVINGTEEAAEEETGGQALPLRASSVFNLPLRAADGSLAGVVADLVLATASGNSFVVVDSADRLVPVPWRYFRWFPDRGELVYNQPTERLEDAPAFESLRQFDPGVPGWDAEIAAYWE